eukprot:Lankesteria_metandrocarpae@DN674_c0_g1_i1.p1
MATTEVKVVTTAPIDGQKPGTSGLRKKTKVFVEGYYLHNFVQSIFNALSEKEVKGGTLLVSGDGRYYNKQAVSIISNIAFANGVSRVWIGKDAIMGTPAASAVVREREGGIAFGAVILSASHNPGGPDEDFGIKYNCANGGPAPDNVTNAIYEETKKIRTFKTLSLPTLDISTIGIQKFGTYTVEVIDPVNDWMNIMKRTFDFDLIRSLIKRTDFKMLYDGMHGVAGPYAEALFCTELGADSSCLMNCVPKEDFGGGHPDPNLTYAKALVEKLGVLDSSKVNSDTPSFGAAGDGDNDRNMILGKGMFVTPSDSVALIADYGQVCIPYFKMGIKGLSRSLPTSAALDLVAKKKLLTLYEVPTGWKYFGNLMDAGKISICGEESFGTGSDHIREKDGLWAVLAWLSILAYRNKNAPTGQLISVKQIVSEFWKVYGRCYYSRYDYEGVESDKADLVMNRLKALVDGGAANIVNSEAVNAATKLLLLATPLSTTENFSYTDPVDGAVSSNQGLKFVFANGSRIIWRLSGTGSSGATIRVYFEAYEQSGGDLEVETQLKLKSIIDVAAGLSQLADLTGCLAPSVIT